jgi:serine/threonine protein kinase
LLTLCHLSISLLGHYHAFNSGRVLHRDLSENNLMFDRADEGGVNGVLNDWDMASILNQLGEVPAKSATHRTGTPRFMAHELLDDTPPAHLYRHDLESFFYILIWAALHYDFGEKTRADKVAKVVQHWDAGLGPASVAIKWTFLSNKAQSQKIFDAVRPEFKELKRTWLKPLWKLFNEALRSRPDTPDSDEEDLEDSGPPYNYQTLGGRLTFHSFMKAIGREERGLNPSPK